MRTGVPCPPVRTLLREDDIATTYAVQRLYVERSLGEGRRLVGRKIGLPGGPTRSSGRSGRISGRLRPHAATPVAVTFTPT